MEERKEGRTGRRMKGREEGRERWREEERGWYSTKKLNTTKNKKNMKKIGGGH